VKYFWLEDRVLQIVGVTLMSSEKATSKQLVSQIEDEIENDTEARSDSASEAVDGQ
jgi:hypothetical protein